jgi:hypothetical protein
MEEEEREIERGETGVRILLSVLYLIIARVVGLVLLVIIVFELLYALITKSPPGERVRRFANRTLSYYYRLGRFLTYNEHQAPFPFAELPDEVEPTGPGYREEGREAEFPEQE